MKKNEPKPRMFLERRSKKLGDRALSKMDLEFCRDLLKENYNLFHDPDSNLSRALWIAIIIKLTSCFDSGSNSRNHIDHKEIFRSDKKMLDAYELISNLRDKHFAHDENYCYQQRIRLSLDDDLNINEICTISIRADMNNKMYDIVKEFIDKSVIYIENPLTKLSKTFIRKFLPCRKMILRIFLKWSLQGMY